MPKTVKRRKNKLAGRYRNWWPDEAEISGRMIPKWVADSCRNRWPDHPEICKNHHLRFPLNIQTSDAGCIVPQLGTPDIYEHANPGRRPWRLDHPVDLELLHRQDLKR